MCAGVLEKVIPRQLNVLDGDRGEAGGRVGDVTRACCARDYYVKMRHLRAATCVFLGSAI